MFARNLRHFAWGLFIGIILTAAIAIWLAIAYWPRPGLPGKVSVEPTQQEERRADMVLETRPAGEFAAVVTRPPVTIKSPEKIREIPSAGEEKTAEALKATLEMGQSPLPGGETAAEASGEATEEMPSGWMVGDRVEAAPMSGMLEARIVDKRTGEELGVAEVAIAGIIEAYFAAPGRLELRGEFAANPVTIAINTPDSLPPAAHRIGLMYSSAGGLAAYYRHDWLLAKAGRLDVLGWARVIIGQDVREIAVGIEAAF